jgi:hypothetical protein
MITSYDGVSYNDVFPVATGGATKYTRDQNLLAWSRFRVAKQIVMTSGPVRQYAIEVADVLWRPIR